MPTTIMNNISSSNKSKEVLFKNAGGLHRHFTEQQMERIQNRPTRAAAIEFLSDSSGNTDNNIDWKLLPQRLDYLCRAIDRWESECENGEEDEEDLLFYDSSFFDDKLVAMKSARLSAMTASFMALAPSSFFKAFESLIQASLDCRDCSFSSDDDNLDSCEDYVQAILSGHNDDDISPLDYNEAEQSLFASIRKTGWIMRRTRGLLYGELAQAIHEVIVRKVKATIEADDDYNPNLYTEQIIEWKERVVEPWLIDFLHGKQEEAQTLKDLEPIWKERLDLTVAELYASAIMDQIFNIVTDYPGSHGTVLELKLLLEKTHNQHAELGTKLRNSLIRRLNHPGANTSQIIDVYIATIKVLRLIDPSDRLLSVVAEPVRTYLRGRNDTVRCIITSLTDAEVGGDLYQELRRQDAKPLENVMVDSDDEEEPPDLYNWQPPPSINKPRGTFLKPIGENSSSTSQQDDCDILAMLVSIYGSKELFVDEYRLMLADKLLANLDYNTDKEVHTLELLKLRFGEMSMRNCEVMIKDMDDSKRSNTLIHSSLETNPPLRRQPALPVGEKSAVDAVMVSHIFWPTLQNKEQLKHHPRIQAQLDEFSDMYAKLKNPRKLEWMNQLGSVQIEIDVVEDSIDGLSPPHVETKEFTCSPLLATLISHFEDKPIWTAVELSNETGVPEHVIQKRMAFWVSNRVVTNLGSQGQLPSRNGRVIAYELASLAQRQHHQQQSGNENNMIMDDDNDHDNKAVSASTQEQEEMEVYESFISAMLTNTGQCSLDRIHNMLKMFVSAGSETKYNKTPQQLSAFLQSLCRQEKLECGPDGMYKLFKKE